MDFNKKLWFEAISRGDVAEVRKILENNIGVINCGDWWQDTGLHLAVLRNNKALVELLLKHGADVTLKNRDGMTALEIAARRGYDDIAAAFEAIALKAKVAAPNLEKDVLDLVTTKDWQGLAALVLECPSVPVYSMIKERFPLSVRMSALQIVVSSLRQLNDGMREEDGALSEKTEQLQSTLRRLEAMKEDCLRKIKDIEGEIEVVQKNMKDTQSKLSDLKIENKEVAVNLTNAEEIFQRQQSCVKHLEETLKKNFTQWAVADVALILEELNLGDYVKVFDTNNITGAVLSRLKSKMLMEKLGMSFKEAKQLSKAIFFLQRGVSIHNEPKGVLMWTNEDVCKWLSETKTAHLVDQFRANEVTGVELAFLDDYDVSHILQVNNLADEIHLIEATESLRTRLNSEYVAKTEETKSTPSEYKTDEELAQKVKRLTIDPPADFICPITQEIMLDPVIASDGHTYERRAIDEWLSQHNSSPLTSQQLENRNLLPSHTLKRMIREFIDNNQPK
jgi:gas vesicle protein